MRSWLLLIGLMAKLPNGKPAAEKLGPTLGHWGSGTGPPGDCRPLVWPTLLILKKLGIAPPQQGFWYSNRVPEPDGSVATDPPGPPPMVLVVPARSVAALLPQRILPVVNTSGAESGEPAVLC